MMLGSEWVVVCLFLVMWDAVQSWCSKKLKSFYLFAPWSCTCSTLCAPGKKESKFANPKWTEPALTVFYLTCFLLSSYSLSLVKFSVALNKKRPFLFHPVSVSVCLSPCLPCTTQHTVYTWVWKIKSGILNLLLTFFFFYIFWMIQKWCLRYLLLLGISGLMWK